MTQILFGKNPVIEVLKARRRKIHECYLEGRKGSPKDSNLSDILGKYSYPVKIVGKKELDSLTGSTHHQGVAVKVDEFPYSFLEDLASKSNDKVLLVMCDSIQDPQNLGAICRSAYCFGADGIILNKDRSVDITPTVVKASAGAVENLSVAKVTNLTRTLTSLKEEEFWSYAADPLADEKLKDVSFSPKTVLVIGSEGEGIRKLLLESCDFRFSIPMVGKFDSLNAAQSASIILYEISRRYNS